MSRFRSRNAAGNLDHRRGEGGRFTGNGGHKKGRGGVAGNTRAFGRYKARGSKGARALPSRKRRVARATLTAGVAFAGGAVVPFVGAPAALAYRRKRQRARGDVGLRSTLTGRKLN